MKLKFDVTAQEYTIIQTILNSHLSSVCKVWVFGSRANNTSRFNSDLDLAFDCGSKMPAKTIALLKDEFNESKLAFSIDLVDMHRVEAYFKQIIDEQKVTFSIKRNVPELRFFEFSGEWEEKRLGNIAELTSSKRVYLSDYVDKGIPFYRGKEISELRIGLKPSDILYITEDRYEDFKEKYGVPLIGDILITAVGTLGNVLKIRNNNKFYFKDGNLIWLRKIKESSDYLEIILQFKTRELLRTSIGSTQKALTMVELRKLFFFFPIVEEQQKIATFLSAVDKKLGNLRRKYALLETYKRGIMQKIFSPFDDTEGKPLRFKQDNGADFPDWENISFENIAKRVSSKFNPKDSNESPILIELENIAPKMGRTIGQSAIEEQSSMKTQFNSGDVLFGKLRPYLKKFAQPSFDGVCSSEIWVLRGIEVSNNFLFFLIQTFRFMQFANQSSGSKMPRSDWSVVKNSMFKIPHAEEQQKIANFLSTLDKKLEAIQKQIDQTELFKKGLLQKMFV